MQITCQQDVCNISRISRKCVFSVLRQGLDSIHIATPYGMEKLEFGPSDYKPAQRSLYQRPQGTLEWKNKSIKKDVYRRLLLTKVVPAIKEKWPRGEWRSTQTVIRIQQDGPNSHIKPDNKEFHESLKEMGLHNKILLYTQPPNSPDLNINDLGFFRR